VHISCMLLDDFLHWPLLYAVRRRLVSLAVASPRVLFHHKDKNVLYLKKRRMGTSNASEVYSHYITTIIFQRKGGLLSPEIHASGVASRQSCRDGCFNWNPEVNTVVFLTCYLLLTSPSLCKYAGCEFDIPAPPRVHFVTMKDYRATTHQHPDLS